MEFVHVELKRDTWFKPHKKIQNEEEAIEFVRQMIGNLDREVIIVIFTAESGQVINASICSIGAESSSICSVSEILRTALLAGGKNIILCHNHPSGSKTASLEDLKITKKLAVACKFMDITLLDHILIAGTETVSFRQEYRDVLDTSGFDLPELLIGSRKTV